MIFKNISKTKLSLALISLVITFLVWQQGLRDSLNRPSVSFDISQKEQEIVELAVQSIPTNLKKFFITNEPVDEINNALSKVEFNGLTIALVIGGLSTHCSETISNIIPSGQSSLGSDILEV